ncbi:hypothetical protein H109_07714 [Trichophyton interdigitale MR816]|uniref:Uncharacterized protein n=1 Tax=Trichophyton interdigitale (strain MR816) TaxID=1215338 RepID=A0A059IXI7_TRIIM|nr:hypothetical protein H109_07714 [Trichophyton interdigitale MR816]
MDMDMDMDVDVDMDGISALRHGKTWRRTQRQAGRKVVTTSIDTVTFEGESCLYCKAIKPVDLPGRTQSKEPCLSLPANKIRQQAESSRKAEKQTAQPSQGRAEQSRAEQSRADKTSSPRPPRTGLS